MSCRASTRAKAIKALFFAYLIGLTVLLVIPIPSMTEAGETPLRWIIRHVSAWSHLLAFLVLAVLALAVRPGHAGARVGVVLCIYAAGTELAQAALPWRSGQWSDFVQDVAGIAIALLVWAVLKIRRSNPTR